jgi:hypothetical protein
MHRPETWGYVQFSTEPPGTDSFRPDPTYPGRVILHRIYYAQHRHRRDTGEWARSLDDLGLPWLSHESVAAGPVLERVEPEGWIASVTLRTDDGRTVLRIRPDSKITSARQDG